LVAELDAHQATDTDLQQVRPDLVATYLNLETPQNNTVVANNQLLTVRQEPDVGDLSDMSCPTFSGRQFEEAPQHVKRVRIYIACKKLPARAALPLPVDGECHMAEISYFAFTLRKGATLWFNSLTISNAVPVVVVRAIWTLEAICAAFEAHYLFDPAQKWRYLSDFVKTKQTYG